MDVRQGSIVVPALKIAMHGAARRQILRQGPPLTGGAENVENAVQHVPDHDLSLTPATFRRRDQRLNQAPLSLGQVTGIAQTLAFVLGAVLGRPHEAPGASVPRIESQAIRAGQAPSLTDSKDSRTSGTDTQRSTNMRDIREHPAASNGIARRAISNTAG